MGLLGHSQRPTRLADLVNASPFQLQVWAYKFGQPDCGPDYVFLADAVEEMGVALFPDAWTGKETRALTNNALYTLPPPRIGDPAGGVPPSLRDEWSAKNRAVAAMYTLGAAARAARLETFIFVDGPLVIEVEPIPQRPSFWFGTDRLKHFYRACGQVRTPNNTLAEGWIMFSRPSLDRVIANIPGAAVSLSPAELTNLPPPMRIALDLIKANPDLAAASNKDRKKMVRSAWNAMFPDAESETYIDAIATVLAEPDIEMIRREKEKRRAREKSGTPGEG